jgi:TonB family protein
MIKGLQLFLVAVSLHYFLLVSAGHPLNRNLAADRETTVTLTYQSRSQDPKPTEADQLNAAIVQLFELGKFKEALPLAKRVLQIREQQFGVEDPRVRTAVMNLAEIYIAMGKPSDAEPLYERLVKSYEKTSPGDPELATILDRLALVQHAHGNIGKAEELYRASLEVREKAWGANHDRTRIGVFHLAELYQLTGDYKKAEPLYQRLLSMHESSPTAKRAYDEEWMEAVDRYACLLRKTKRAAEADELEKRKYRGAEAGLPSTPDNDARDKILNGMAISLPKPAYPPEARAARASGEVKVRVFIDERGRVLRACATSGPPQLWRESERAAFRARFTPTKLSGRPVKVTGIITYRYIVAM